MATDDDDGDDDANDCDDVGGDDMMTVMIVMIARDGMPNPIKTLTDSIDSQKTSPTDSQYSRERFQLGLLHDARQCPCKVDDAQHGPDRSDLEHHDDICLRTSC